MRAANKKRWLETASFDPVERQGRPSIMDSPGHLKALRDANHDLRGAGARLLAPQVSGGRMYRGERRESVSHTTILRWKKIVRYITKGVKFRPSISRVSPSVSDTNIPPFKKID
eukprot:COSAG01_NODE_401_length_17529_cov_47.865806_5_plen_114_part_00